MAGFTSIPVTLRTLFKKKPRGEADPPSPRRSGINVGLYVIYVCVWSGRPRFLYLYRETAAVRLARSYFKKLPLNENS